MSMVDWARQEVALAIANEKPEDRKYVKLCANSALKAYELLMGEGHSGMSWSVTRYLLIKLMNEEPLSPIKINDEVWEPCEGSTDKEDVYQCTRRPSLFKYVNRSTGAKRFYDTERVVGIDIDDPNSGYYHSNLLYAIMDEMFPIKFPYMPSKPIKVATADCLCDKSKGDFDTVLVKDAILPNGTIMPINRYFRSPNNAAEKCRYPHWVEIDVNEYKTRLENKIK